MIRPSNMFVIWKKDLKSGVVKRKRFKKLIEYWYYEGQETSIEDIHGNKMVDNTNMQLKSIVVCDCESHITKEGNNGFTVDGIKFTEKDMDDYLHKTGRSRA